MYIKDIVTTWADYPSLSDLAVEVVFAGCSHGCAGCHNQQLQDYRQGTLWQPKDVADQLIQQCKSNRTNKIVLSGGDPLFEANRDAAIYLADNLLALGYEVCIYTGYEIANIKNWQAHATWFKCGTYNKEISRDSGKIGDQFILASANQSWYDSKYVLRSHNGIMKIY